MIQKFWERTLWSWEVKKGFSVWVQCKLGVRLQVGLRYMEKSLVALSEEWEILNKGIFPRNEETV